MGTVVGNRNAPVVGRFVVFFTPKRAAACLNLVICLAIALTVWDFYNEVWSDQQAVARGLGSNPVSTSLRNRNVDVEGIASRHLFGKPPQEATEEPEVQFVPETSLDLALAGVVAMGAADGSQAIVKAEGEDPRAYSIGDSLPGDAVVHQISARYIVIRRGSSYETVWMARDKPTDRAQQMIAIGREKKRDVANSEGADRNADGPIALTEKERKTLAEARHAVFEEKAPASRFARLQAIYREGDLTGYRVFPGRDSALFDALKLERGDTVISVNGIDLSHKVPADELTDALASGEKLTLRVERNGRARVFEYDLNP